MEPSLPSFIRAASSSESESESTPAEESVRSTIDEESEWEIAVGAVLLDDLGVPVPAADFRELDQAPRT